MKLSENSVSLVIPGLTIIIAAVSFWFVLKPSIENILVGRENLEKNKKELAVLAEKVAFLKGIEDGELASDLNKAELALPSEKSIPGLLGGLERMAKEASASIESFAISPGIVSTSSAETAGTNANANLQIKLTDFQLPSPYVGFTITLKSNYGQLKSFLTRTRQAARVMAVTDLNFTSKSKNLEDRVQVTMSLAAYYQNLPMTITKIGEPISPISNSDRKILEKVRSLEVYSLTPPLVPTGKTNPFLPY